jgi:hypothetical protein
MREEVVQGKLPQGIPPSTHHAHWFFKRPDDPAGFWIAVMKGHLGMP